ncbi:Ger(x)C family spore germination protein [Neobacillus fumarioli]|uniref:Ger(x)C family spore germination protein n=1 Tax=Neobacillus fumarioli TaxID=105229 RepID=UPI00082C2E58|nr:Ger(x)C family spore germination protein [Neobacillus fumarioli]
MGKSRKTPVILLSLSLFLLLSLAGCSSSSREIEKRSLVIGLALDKGKESKTEKILNEKGVGYSKRNLVTITHQVVITQATSKGAKEGSTQPKSYVNVSSTGDSLIQTVQELSLRTSRPMFVQHMKVVVIGEELLRKMNLQQVLDLLFRDYEIRESVLVFASKGRASDTLELKETSEFPAFLLTGISENQFKSTRILPQVTLAKLTGKMNSNSSFLLQNVIAGNKEIKFAGVAVINGKTKKLLGYLNEDEVEGLTWITGKGKGGIVKTFDTKTHQLVTYEVLSIKSHIQPHVKGSNISFDVKVEAKGRLPEHWVLSDKAFKNEFIKRVETDSEKEVKRLAEHTLRIIQNKYKTDVAGFGNRLRIKYPKVWEKVKKDWDQTFSKVPITYSVKLKINEYGTSG